MKRILAFCGLLSALLCLTAAVAMAAPVVPSALPVVVSIAPQKYMIERIGGEHVSVTVLVKPGADPHSYEPTPAQMRECATARLYFSIGVPFEDAWLPRISGAAKDLVVVSTIRDIMRMSADDTHKDGESLGHDDDKAHGHDEGESHGHDAEKAHGLGDADDADDADADHAHIDAAHEHTDDEHDHDEGGEDPHVWLSPLTVKLMLPGIVEALSAAMPEQAATFQANADAFAKELQALHTDLEAQFATVPQAKRVFLTFHPSWGYFAYEFNLKELSIEVEGKEPGPRAMKAIIDAARENGLTTIFVEPQFPTAAATAVAGNINAAVVRIDPQAENLPENLRTTARLLLESFPK